VQQLALLDVDRRATMNVCRVKAGDGVVDGMRCDDREGRGNGVDDWRGTDDDAAAVDENRSSSMNDDNDQWTPCRPESVWLEYLYAWNPLAAGNQHVNRASRTHLIYGLFN